MSVLAATVPYDSVWPVQLCTTLYDSVQLCKTLYYFVPLCTTLYFWNLTIYRRDTRGWDMPKHLNFKKRNKDEKTYTFSCNVRKVLGNTAINEGVYIKFKISSSPKNDTSQKTRNIPLSSPMFVIKWCNQCRNWYIILSILLN